VAQVAGAPPLRRRRVPPSTRSIGAAGRLLRAGASSGGRGAARRGRSRARGWGQGRGAGRGSRTAALPCCRQGGDRQTPRARVPGGGLAAGGARAAAAGLAQRVGLRESACRRAPRRWRALRADAAREPRHPRLRPRPSRAVPSRARSPAGSHGAVGHRAMGGRAAARLRPRRRAGVSAPPAARAPAHRAMPGDGCAHATGLQGAGPPAGGALCPRVPAHGGRRGPAR
jgi:hypothetical protein